MRAFSLRTSVAEEQSPEKQCNNNLGGGKKERLGLEDEELKEEGTEVGKVVFDNKEVEDDEEVNQGGR